MKLTVDGVVPSSQAIIDAIKDDGTFDQWNLELMNKFMEENSDIFVKVREILEKTDLFKDLRRDTERDIIKRVNLEVDGALSDEVNMKLMDELLKGDWTEKIEIKVEDVGKSLQNQYNERKVNEEAFEKIALLQQQQDDLKKKLEEYEKENRSVSNQLVNLDEDLMEDELPVPQKRDEAKSQQEFDQFFGSSMNVEKQFPRLENERYGYVSIPTLFNHKMLLSGDKILFKTPKKEAIGIINEKGKIVWTNPENQTQMFFENLSHFSGYVDKSTNPKPAQSTQYDGWNNCFLIDKNNKLISMLDIKLKYESLQPVKETETK